MLAKIRRLGAETAIYGISTVLGRFLTFLLTPLYANLLPPSDLGIVATVYSYIAVLNVIYHVGMDSAYMKFVSTMELAGRKETFLIPLVSVTIVSVLLSVSITIGSRNLSELIGIGTDLQHIIVYSSLILLLDAMALIPFATLRMERKAKLFAATKIAGIAVNVLTAYLLLVEYEMGLDGVFLAGIVSSGFTVMLLVPTIVRNVTFAWPRGVLKGMLAFGLPTLPAGLATIALQVIDRPILEGLTDKATVGIYQANYRLGIFMMLVVSMFEFAWRPFSFAHARDSDAKPLFARVFTYLVLIMISVFLVLSFFIEDIVKAPLFFGYSILPASYHEGLSIIPIILLAYMFLGASTVFSAGLFIEKKTLRLPVVTLIGAAVNIVANFLLIPQLGIHGAAIAALVSYAVMAVVMFMYGQHAFHIPYEYRRITKVLATGTSIVALNELIPWPQPAWPWRFLLLFLFLALLYWMRFFRTSEIRIIKDLWTPGKKSDETPPPDIRGE